METALAYARQWLHLDGGTAHEVATVLLGLGWIDRPKRIYVDPGRGLLDPETDRRLNILCRARHTNPQLHDNYRYWLIYYRALCEAFCVVDGELPLDWLNQEVSICREALKNTEPSYARHLSSVHPNELPGVTAWCWPRSFKHYWSREMDYESPSENAIRGTSVI